MSIFTNWWHLIQDWFLAIFASSGSKSPSTTTNDNADTNKTGETVDNN